MPKTLQAKRFYVSGMVQGVGFRFFAQRVAEHLGVAGYVKNMRDGRVEVYAIGRGEQLRRLRAELERGPRSASISEITEEEAEMMPRYMGQFSIEHDW
ncbi:MAG TPA: acylphosphatase [Candidatus Acidoferrales bacterium]|nr:acylphosphatase [Candidatus Acidoferrales bacterium]